MAARFCAAGGHLGLVVYVHAPRGIGAGLPANRRIARGDSGPVFAADFAGAGPRPHAAPALETGVCGGHTEFGHTVCLLYLCPADHFNRAVVHPECHGAPVWRIDRLGVAQRPPGPCPHRGPVDWFLGGRHAGLGQGQLQDRRERQHTGLGGTGVLLACLCYGISASITKRYMAGMPSLVSATGSQMGAALVLAPFTVWNWPDHPVPASAWLAVIALGVMCTGLAYILFFRLIERAGPARALSVTFAIPVFAVLYGVVLLGEVVTPWMLVCALVIVVGTSLSSGLVGVRK